jgi:hypothetical protein
LNEKEKHLDSLPAHHRTILASFAEHLRKARDCIERNAEFIDEMITGAETMFLNEDGYCYVSGLDSCV